MVAFIPLKNDLGEEKNILPSIFVGLFLFILETIGIHVTKVSSLLDNALRLFKVYSSRKTRETLVVWDRVNSVLPKALEGKYWVRRDKKGRGKKDVFHIRSWHILILRGGKLCQRSLLEASVFEFSWLEFTLSQSPKHFSIFQMICL